MPIRPKSVNRPWIVKTDYDAMQGQGRKVVNGFYNTRIWKRFKTLFINGYSTHLGTIHPHPNRLCIDCAKRDIVTPTHTIDHIRPINPMDSYNTMSGLFGEPLKWENCQPLCSSCHAKKSGKERHEY